MLHTLAFFLVLGLVLFGGNAKAQTDAFNTALAQGDFQAVQTLVAGNPGLADQAADVLLTFAAANVGKEGQHEKAAAALTSIAAFVSLVTPAHAAQIAAQVSSIVTVALASCLGSCASSPSVAAILSAGSSLAKSPTIVAAAPALLSQIALSMAQNNITSTSQANTRNSTVQLAQQPLSLQTPREPPRTYLPSAE